MGKHTIKDVGLHSPTNVPSVQHIRLERSIKIISGTTQTYRSVQQACSTAISVRLNIPPYQAHLKV